MKQQISIRIDKDVLAWFRAKNPRYQSSINRLLRRHVDLQKAKAARQNEAAKLIKRGMIKLSDIEIVEPDFSEERWA